MAVYPQVLGDGRGRSAELHSAVPQIWNLQDVGEIVASRHFPRPADSKSAIRQSATLRYENDRPKQQLGIPFRSAILSRMVHR